jgi:hypothetical protein
LGEAHFAHGMCKSCFLEFYSTTGGMHAGANPPAYEAARLREQQEAQRQQEEAGVGGGAGGGGALRAIAGGGGAGEEGEELLALPAPGETGI